MSIVKNFAFGVETMLFRSNLMVSRSAVGLTQLLGQLILSPPTSSRVLFGSSFLGSIRL